MAVSVQGFGKMQRIWCLVLLSVFAGLIGDANCAKKAKHEHSCPGVAPTASDMDIFSVAQKYLNDGKLDVATECCHYMMELNPNSQSARYLLGGIAFTKNDYHEALNWFLKVTELVPTVAAPWNDVGLTYQRLGLHQKAEEAYKKALSLDDKYSLAWSNLGELYKDQSKWDECFKAFQDGLAKDTAAILYNNYGAAVHEKAKRTKDAKLHKKSIQIYEEGIAKYPKMAELQVNKGIALEDLYGISKNKNDAWKAYDCYKKAVELQPDMVTARNLAGNLIAFLGETDQGLELMEPIMEKDYKALCFVARIYQRTCSWDKLAAIFPRLLELVEAQANGQLINGQKISCMNPWEALTYNFSADLTLRIAAQYGKQEQREASAVMQPYDWTIPHDLTKLPPAKLRVGYLSSDFLNHATGYLIAGMLGFHQRAIVDIYCYSFAPSDGSHTRSLIESNCGTFKDMSTYSLEKSVRTIKADKIQILVNLDGYVHGARMDVMSLRPAPIQVQYLGFPGSTGADFIDYLITDKIVVPSNHTQYYSEKMIYMPTTFFVNNHKAMFPTFTGPTALKPYLPGEEFIFCNFNLLYKIDPEIFDVWMNVLKKVPKSVLWLLESPAEGADKLEAEAEKRGVPKNRLKFWPHAAIAEHIDRVSKAHLFLDTLNYNGHTSATDALWAGTPVLTKPGIKFQSRVAASLLQNVGLPQLVAWDMKQYEDKAVMLATDASYYNQFRQALHNYKGYKPLFDPMLRARELEAAYQLAWQNHAAKNPPKHIDTPPQE